MQRKKKINKNLQTIALLVMDKREDKEDGQ